MGWNQSLTGPSPGPLRALRALCGSPQSPVFEYNETVQRIPRALTIAGSDSGGCAGIQADLKTFAALGVHGMTAITSVTAQDTVKVHMVSDVPLENIEFQIEAVIQDIGVDAVKTGMLSSKEIIKLVAGQMRKHRITNLVVDPVMVSTSGDPLIRDDAVEALKADLFPLALVVTPNLREAECLSRRRIRRQSDLEEAASEIFGLGPKAVLIKGGHFQDSRLAEDYLFDGRRFIPFPAERFQTRNTHGSGCTFASAIAAWLAHGLPLEEAVGRAKDYVTEAIRNSFSIGHGAGPLGHFHRFWE
jgi:hydroxymethylpyrimidine/phosphomethylpyrimidine kinase